MSLQRFVLTSTAVAASICGSTVSLAQNTPANQTGQGQGDNTQASSPTPEQAQGGIEEIVVTAQRRSENLQRASVAVTAVTGDALRAAGVTKPAELTSLVPALQVAPAGPYNVFYLRGVGSFSSNPFADSAVAFNLDGVYVGRPSSTTGYFYDLERIEVVKGPQGTLYGRNATGGAINVLSRKPDLQKFGGEFSAEYGDYSALRLDGAVNVPLGDLAAVRIAGMRVKHDGYMNDDTDDQDDSGARVSFRVDPSEDLRIVVVADYFDQGGDGTGATLRLAPLGVPAATASNVDDRIGLLSAEGQALYTSQPIQIMGRNFAAIPLPEERPFLDNQFWGISATVDWETAIGTLTVIPAYRESELNNQHFQPGFYNRQKESSDQTSLEARFATSEEAPLRALVGAFYYKENQNDPFVTYGLQGQGVFDHDINLDTESKALFGRLTYAITPDIRLNVGARQTWESKSFTGNRLTVSRLCIPLPFTTCPDAPVIPYDTSPPAVPGVVVPVFGPPPYGGIIQFNPDGSPRLIQTAAPTNADNQRDFDKFTWRAGADWDVTPQNLLYASFETGFKAGGFFVAADNPATPEVEGTYQPETLEAYTVGSKNRFFDNRVELNAELFHWRYKDQQISHLTYDYQNSVVLATENVGQATFQGIEVEGRWAPTDTTTLSADVQYLDAKYDKFRYESPNLNGGFFNGTGCANAAAPGAFYVIDCSGERPPSAPEWTVNLGAQQKVPLSIGDLVFDARAHYQSETLTGLEFLPVEVQDSYWLVDAAVTYHSPEQRYFVGAYVNNVFDETPISLTFPTALSDMYGSSLRPPRTYGLRAGISF